MGESNPVQELLLAIDASHPAPKGDESALDAAAGYIPGRQETAVADLLNSDAYKRFETAYVNAKIEANLVTEVVGLIKAMLAARGLI